MELKLLVTILVFFISFSASYGQSASCRYYISNYGYTCDLTISNAAGWNNFTIITGTHMLNRSDDDIRRIIGVSGSTQNVPSIICNKFSFTTRIDLGSREIQTVDDYSFRNCARLTFLNLNSNRIASIHEDSFANNTELLNLLLFSNQLTILPVKVFSNLQKLTALNLDSNRIATLPSSYSWFSNLTNLITLHFSSNLIQELPLGTFQSLRRLQSLSLMSNRIVNLTVGIFEPLTSLTFLTLSSNQLTELPFGVFSSLIRLRILSMHENRIKMLHAGSFGVLSNLTEAYFPNNQIDAIDEGLVDNTSIWVLDVRNNLCVNNLIFDTSETRQSMRNALAKCFENFEVLGSETSPLPPTTTTDPQQTTTESLPPGCIAESLNTRICSVEDEMEILKEQNEDLLSEIQNLYKKNEDLERRLESSTNNVGIILDKLQYQIRELKGCSCSC